MSGFEKKMGFLYWEGDGITWVVRLFNWRGRLLFK